MSETTAESERFEEYLNQLARALDHADRERPLRAYLTGLLLPGERKSVEPMAALVDPRHVRKLHQSMHHLVANAPWDDQAVLRLAREQVLEQMLSHGALGAWVVDDTGIPKKGTHSVGVARQYCGQLQSVENCQDVVSISLANASVSVPAFYRLYLPDAWTKDRARCKAAGVPAQVRFKTKLELALEGIDALLGDDVPRAPAIADAGYGRSTEFRAALRDRGMLYCVGIDPQTVVWPPGSGPLPPPKGGKPGRQPTRLRRSEKHQPVSVRDFAVSLPKSDWKQVQWREGTRGLMSTRACAVRLRPASNDNCMTEPHPLEWLLIEWPEGETEPTRYYFCSLPEKAKLEDLVRLAKLRWRIERDYEELKGLGLNHFEGRNWRGFHHHGALCIAAYAFLAAERARLSPPAPLAFLRAAPVPEGFRPRGSPDPR